MDGSWELDMSNNQSPDMSDTPDAEPDTDEAPDTDMELMCTPGEEDCACDDGVCEGGLACVEDVCVPADLPSCGEDERVEDGACVACEAGSTNDEGDDPNGSDTSCDAVICAEDEYVDGNACVVCEAGSTNEAGDDASGANTSCDVTVCPEDHRVASNACVPCQPGTTRAAGDEATGPNTMCEATLCGQDEFVTGNACEVCAMGTQNAAGDDASGQNTVCDPIYCGADEYVSSNVCVACPADTSNEPGDDASGPDTACREFCQQDEFVFNNICNACAPGTTRAAGDEATGPNTLCDALLCGQDEFVSGNACVACAPGTENAVGDDASGQDTACDAVICAEDEYVSGNACVLCAPGTTNPAGDDASGADTICNAVICGEDEYVVSHACASCPAGTTNAAGDDASGADTMCDATLCGEDEYVTANACVACPADTTNVTGDDASGADTTCDDPCIDSLGAYCFEFIPTYVKASNTSGGDWFGLELAMDGDTLVVGAMFEDSNANNAGAAYVFVRDAATGTWSQQALLKASNPSAGDRFGESIDISGDTIVVGATNEDTGAGNSGAAYVFVRDTSTNTWSEQAMLKASNAGGNDYFGHDVAVDGDTIAVGADEEDSGASNSGAAYVFVRDTATNTWSEQAMLKAANPEANDNFGWKIAMDGDTVAVSAINEDGGIAGVNGDQADNSATDSGAVYVFTRDATGTWSQQAYLKAATPNSPVQMGVGLAVDGDTVVVGSSRDTSAHVFVRDAAGSWSQQAFLQSNNLDTGDNFGRNVDIDGDLLIVSGYSEDGSATTVNGADDNNRQGAGAAYVFRRDAAGAWTQIAYVKASNAGVDDGFAHGVAISGDVIACGAFREESNATGIDGDQGNNSANDAGAVYIYDLSP